jgi:hypothetical protein
MALERKESEDGTMTTDGLISQMTTKIRQSICALHGHDALMHFEKGHISLLCTSCGHQSPGWEFGAGARRATPAATATPARTGVVMPFVNARKVA